MSPDDAPELAQGVWPEKFANARVRRGRPPIANAKDSTAIRLSPEIIGHFKAGGLGWQTRINEALLDWIRSNASE